MSANENRVPLETARRLADEVVEVLLPGCERIEVAGSVRRKKAMVSDIDLVCVAREAQTLFQAGSLVSLPGIIALAVDQRGWKLLKNGPHQKKIDIGPLAVELYITTPAQWGVMFLLRTGDAEFSHWCVTARKFGGALPSNMQIADGRVWQGGALDTPEEMDVFNALRLKWIDPQYRIGRMSGSLIWDHA